MTDITELAQRARINAECGEHLSPAETMELVVALESEKRICATWRKTAKSTGEKLEKAQTINAAAEKLVRCKGRYHSEQNYRALAALFGVNTPDLPPLEHENVHYADAAEIEIAALRQRIADMESTRDDIPFGFDESGNNELAAFKLALAAMDSEPVAWTDEEELRDVNVAGIGYLFGIDREANKFADPRRQIMLYRHAQPAQVAYSDFEEFWSAYIHPLAQDDELKDFAWDIWNACRAAMLSGGKS